jgi:Ca2+:H+ antiporter
MSGAKKKEDWAELKQAVTKGQQGSHGTFDEPSPIIKPTYQRPMETEEDVQPGEDDRETFTLVGQIRKCFTTFWQLKLLLVFVPLCFVGKVGAYGDGFLFLTSFIGLIPLAGMLGDFTEDICKRSNDVVGALVNVTFGNATELILSIMALRAGLLELIKFALIGSVLGNMLLVMGSAFLLGGLRRQTLTFNSDAANTYIPLLLLSSMSFIIPTGYAVTAEKTSPVESPTKTIKKLASTLQSNNSTSAAMMHGDLSVEETVLLASRQIALVTAFIYVGYLVFQLYTHKNVFDDINSENEAEAGSHEEENDDDEDKPEFTLVFAIVGLAVVSVLISYLSDVLVDSVSGAAIQYNVPHQFIGLILVPIVGNAAEHASAILMAQKGRTDVAVGVALGSSIQIALFVMPVLVLAGWIINVPLDLNFHPFPTIVMFISVMVASHVTSDGKTNWLEGLMLLGAYAMVAILFFHGNVSMR